MADLIDRSELKKGLCAECTLLHGKCPEKNGGECDWDAIGHINSAPRVDAEPVVQGKWHHDITGANFCSRCMKYAYEDGEYHMIWHTQYCPHCGAKMDEEGGQNDDI